MATTTRDDFDLNNGFVWNIYDSGSFYKTIVTAFGDDVHCFEKELFEHDSDLDPLRDNPRFQELLARL